MKKKVFIFLFNIILLLIIMPQVNTQITGETVTGEATASNVAIAITLSGLPSLSLLSPENKTYLSNESILLNFTANSEDFVWYVLDDNSNMTITSSINFNVSQGNHTLNLYANNSEGTRTKSVNFTANSTIFNIIYNEYFKSNKGNSTNFNKSTYEDIQNLSNVILENSQKGKITFNEVINLTDDFNPSDNLLDINNNINISSNRIEINSTALPNFNKTATLIFYGLSFSDPRILRDGSICASSICTKNSFSGGNLSFNVTQFTIYSAEETPSDGTGSTSSGGGGSSKIVSGEIIKLNKNRISITLKQGATKSEEIIITNLRNSIRSIDLEISGIKDFIKLSEESFGLKPGESKTISLRFFSDENTIPNLYQGKLIVKSGSAEKEILIAIDVESIEPLFDVTLEIPDAFLKVVPGEEVIANIKLFEVQQVGKVDVKLEYSIKDQDSNLIISDAETIAVDRQANFVKSLKIPLETKEGDYLFYVKLTYNGEVASASEWFNVVKKSALKSEKLFNIVISILLIIILAVIITNFYKIRKHEKIHKKHHH